MILSIEERWNIKKYKKYFLGCNETLEKLTSCNFPEIISIPLLHLQKMVPLFVQVITRSQFERNQVCNNKL